MDLFTWVSGRRASFVGRSRGFLRRRVVGGLLRRVSHPSGSDLTGGRLVAVSAKPILDALFPERDAKHWDQLLLESADVRERMAPRYDDGRFLIRPRDWAAGPTTCDLLYCIVRTLRPEVVVETGAANGATTLHIVSALRANGTGHLHSTDVERLAGPLLDPGDREWWTLHVVDWKRTRSTWRRIVEGLPPADLFFHDSDHSYGWQLREYRAALGLLRPGGILASDDVQATYAFLDLCREAGLAPAMLIENGKVAGAVRVR
jgi:predicted O-methyltransferase YrrM